MSQPNVTLLIASRRSTRRRTPSSASTLTSPSQWTPTRSSSPAACSPTSPAPTRASSSTWTRWTWTRTACSGSSARAGPGTSTASRPRSMTPASPPPSASRGLSLHAHQSRLYRIHFSDYTDKIVAGNYKTPEELFVRPDEFLFLTCSDPQVNN